jgi:hypothetical protein
MLLRSALRLSHRVDVLLHLIELLLRLNVGHGWSVIRAMIPAIGAAIPAPDGLAQPGESGETPRRCPSRTLEAHGERNGAQRAAERSSA